MINIIEKFNKNRNLLNGTLFAIFSFFNRGLNFLLILILANFISPSDYGYLNLFNTFVMVVGYFIAFSMEGYLSVAYFREGLVGVKNTISNVISTNIIMTLLLITTAIIGGNSLSETLSISQPLIIIGILVGTFSVFTNVLLDLYRIEEKVFTYGLISCGITLLNFISSIILIKYLYFGWEGRVYSQISLCVIFGLLCLIALIKRKYLIKPNIQYLKGMLLWSLPLIPHLATSFIRQGCDRYIINENYGIDDVGLFSFALNLCNIITMIGFGFNQSNSVNIYKICGDKSMLYYEKIKILSQQRRLYFFMYIGITVALSTLVYLFIPILMPNYVSSLKYFPILSLYGFFVCIYLIYTNYLFFLKKTKTVMYITVTSALIHLTLSLLLTKYSLMFLCLTYSLTQFIVVLLIRNMAKKLLNNELL